jgi:hypothetical protein
VEIDDDADLDAAEALAARHDRAVASQQVAIPRCCTLARTVCATSRRCWPSTTSTWAAWSWAAAPAPPAARRGASPAPCATTAPTAQPRPPDGRLDQAAALAAYIIEEGVTLAVAVGGGRVHRHGQARVRAHGIDFISVPTTISNDGISSPVASLVGRDGARASTPPHAQRHRRRRRRHRQRARADGSRRRRRPGVNLTPAWTGASPTARAAITTTRSRR